MKAFCIAMQPSLALNFGSLQGAVPPCLAKADNFDSLVPRCIHAPKTELTHIREALQMYILYKECFVAFLK